MNKQEFLAQHSKYAELLNLLPDNIRVNPPMWFRDREVTEIHLNEKLALLCSENGIDFYSIGLKDKEGTCYWKVNGYNQIIEWFKE